MRHEKVFKWENGTKIKVRVFCHLESLPENKVYWQFLVERCFPRKRTFKPAQETLATPDQIEETMLELWQKIKPNFAEISK